MKNRLEIKNTENEFAEITNDVNPWRENNCKDSTDILSENKIPEIIDLVFTNSELKNIQNMKIKKIAKKLEKFFEESNSAEFEHYSKTGRIVFRCTKFCQMDSIAVTSFLRKLLELMNRDVFYLKESKDEVILIFR